MMMRTVRLAIVPGLLLIALLVLRGREIASQVWLNVDAVQDGESTGVLTESAETCPSYITTIERMQRAASNPDGVDQIAQLASCLTEERAPFVAYNQATAFHVAGNYEAACDALRPLLAGRQLRALAVDASENAEWDGVHLYLDCIEQLPQGLSRPSAYYVSELYYQLGKAYRDEGQVDRALVAFDAAVDTHPAVWHEPLIARARIRAEQGDPVPAAATLRDAAGQADSPTVAFFLWYERATILLDVDVAGAYCALLQAAHLDAEIVTSYLSAEQRTALHEQIAQLEATHDTLRPGTCPAPR